MFFRKGFFLLKRIKFLQRMFFFKKESVAFPQEWYVFLSKGFFSKGTGFSFFEGMWFSSFFQMVWFLLFFLQSTRTFFSCSKWLKFSQKNCFLQCFERERNVFSCFFEKKKGWFFLQSVSFFQDFCVSKNQFLLGGFSFNKQVFFIKQFFFQRGVSLKMGGFI